jgi:precorrin-6B methylase 2
VYFINSFFVNAPFIPVRKGVVLPIIEALKLAPGSVLYDLGCGDARILLEATKNTKDIKAIGIEKNYIVYLWAKLLSKNTPVKIY